MAKASTVAILISVSGDGTQDQFTPASSANATAPSGGSQTVALNNATDTSVPIPAGYKGVWIKFTNGVASKKLKWAGGDTGFDLAPAGQHYFELPSGKTALIILCGGAGESCEVFFT